MISFLFVSCDKEILDEPTPEPEPTPVVEQKLIFKAEIESAQTKTTISGNKISWANGDAISINGKNYIYNSTNSDFSAEEGDAQLVDGYYYAYYPYNLYKAADRIEFPSSINYTYEEGKFEMPMFAKSATQNLKFRVISGVLAISVKSTIDNTKGSPISISNIASITVSSDNNALSGQVEIDADNNARLVSPLRPSDVVTVSYSNTPSVSAEGSVFYVPVPVGSYSRLLIEVTDTEGNTSYMKTSDSKNIEIAKNTLYTLAFRNNFAPYQKIVQIVEEEDENNERH